MYMVAVDCMPLRTVEARRFLRFAKTVAPLYKVPSRRKFTKMLDGKFDHLSTIIREKIIQANFYSLTADAWTDSGNAKSYLGMTIHFLEGVEMKGIALSAQPLEESHTKEYLISEMKNICDSWGIDLEKVSCNLYRTMLL